ncbi:MAG: hypothetical protein JSS79_19790 [Bacteroidetes bacterium]|nr:hypothetical protein [Bacteroidota bacterium]
MEQLLLMKNLNLNIVITLSFLILCSFQEPAIDIERVRKDALSSNENIIPEKILSRLRKNRFLVIYQGNYCFVHVPYKSFASESQMKQSIVVVYKMINAEWVLSRILPYFYNIAVIDSYKNIFISENQECGLEGNCNTFTEIDFFESESFTPLANYRGFDKTVYLMNKLNKGGKSEVSNLIGDTIANTYELSKFKSISPRGYSYTLLQQGTILKSVSDTLGIEGFSKLTTINVERNAK